MKPKFTVQTREFAEEEMVILSLLGESTEPILIKEAIEPFIGKVRSIVIDVKFLRYMTSACFGIFFELNVLAGEGSSKIIFFNMQSKFEIIFSALGGTEVFQVIDSISDI